MLFAISDVPLAAGLSPPKAMQRTTRDSQHSHALRKREYDVFISYNRASSQKIAQPLETWIARYARPWWKAGGLRVFRDETNVGFTEGQWKDIAGRLDQSKWLVLISSPGAAQSRWVARELHHWLNPKVPTTATHPWELTPCVSIDPDKRRRLLIVLHEGTIKWKEGTDGRRGDFDWEKTDALPRCLSNVFDEEPGWADARAAVQSPLGRTNLLFMNTVAKIVSEASNRDLPDLISEDSRQYAKTMQTALAAVLALVLLSSALAVASWVTYVAAQLAEWQRQIASAERSGAEARATAALRPQKLQEAAMAASEAFRTLRQLRDETPLPDNLRALLFSIPSCSWIPQSIRFPVERVLKLPESSTPEDLMRQADDLTPTLAWSAGTPEPESISHLAVRRDGSIVALLGSAAIRRLDRGSGWSKPLKVGKALTRINHYPTIAFGTDGIVATEESDHFVRIYNDLLGIVTFKFAPEQYFARHEATLSAAKSLVTDTPLNETFGVSGTSTTASLAGLALNQRGDRLAMVSGDGFVQLLGLSGSATAPVRIGSTWKLDHPRLPDDVKRMSAWMLDNAGEYLAATPSVRPIGVGETPVFLWVAKTGSIPFPPLMHDDMVNALSFSPDSKQLAVGLDNGSVRTWHMRDGTIDRSLEMGVPVQSIAYGSTLAHSLLLVGGGGFARVYDLSTRREVARAPHRGLSHVTWSPDGRWFVTAGADPADAARLRAWKLDGANAVAPALMHPALALDSLAVRGRTIVAHEWPRSIWAWDTLTGAGTAHYSVTSTLGHALAIDTNERSVFAFSNDASALLRTFDLSHDARTSIAGPGLPPVNTGSAWTREAGFSADGKHASRIVSNGDTCSIEVWALKAEAKLVTALPCSSNVYSHVLSPDASLIAWMQADSSELVVASVTKTGVRWRTKVGSAPMEAGHLISFSGDGNRVAAAAGSTVRFYETRMGKLAAPSLEMPGKVADLALDRVGNTLAATLRTRTLVIASADNNQIQNTFGLDADPNGNIVLSEADGMVYAVFGDNSANNPRVWRWRIDPTKVDAALSERLPKIIAAEK